MFDFEGHGFTRRRDAGNMWHWAMRAGDVEIVASASDCGDYPEPGDWAITVARVTGDDWALGADDSAMLYHADTFGPSLAFGDAMALALAIWRHEARQSLAGWYLANIGYDPFADDEATTIAEIEQVRLEWPAIIAEAEAMAGAA